MTSITDLCASLCESPALLLTAHCIAVQTRKRGTVVMDYPFVLWIGNTRGRPGLLQQEGLGDLVTTVAGGTMMCFDETIREALSVVAKRVGGASATIGRRVDHSALLPHPD